MKIFRRLTASLVSFGVMVAACAFVFALAVTFAISSWEEIEISAWNVVAAQIARWFALWAGVYAIHNVMPIAIAHGRTRREFLVATAGFTVVFAFAMALCVWLGYLVEDGVYGLMDWQSSEHGMPHAYFVMFLAWVAVGTFLAAAFDRYGPLGVFSLPIGLVLVVTSGVRVPGSGQLPFVRNIPVLLGAGWHVVSLFAWVLALAGTWLIARNMPVRTKAI